ncbi:hypothetical protein LSAT2_031828 [Lamellibrachia satsuma]|nr:hypothetical protein LSAT2_031828 [Lamellibrachia satsuma]
MENVDYYRDCAALDRCYRSDNKLLVLAATNALLVLTGLEKYFPRTKGKSRPLLNVWSLRGAGGAPLDLFRQSLPLLDIYFYPVEISPNTLLVLISIFLFSVDHPPLFSVLSLSIFPPSFSVCVLPIAVCPHHFHPRVSLYSTSQRNVLIHYASANKKRVLEIQKTLKDRRFDVDLMDENSRVVKLPNTVAAKHLFVLVLVESTESMKNTKFRTVVEYAKHHLDCRTVHLRLPEEDLDVLIHELKFMCSNEVDDTAKFIRSHITRRNSINGHVDAQSSTSDGVDKPTPG